MPSISQESAYVIAFAQSTSRRYAEAAALAASVPGSGVGRVSPGLWR